MNNTPNRFAIAIKGSYLNQRFEEADESLQEASSDIELICDTVRMDAKTRVEMGLAVPLSRYLNLNDSFAEHREAIDAAIQGSLLDLQLRVGLVFDEAVEALESVHPNLIPQIRRSVLLNELEVETGSEVHGLEISLPIFFGEVEFDGKPRYELRQLIGEGAQGRVYSAVDRLMSESSSPAMVAIKVLHQNGDKGVPAEKLLIEARMARKVRHPNIVQVYDAGNTETSFPASYLVYELIDGPNLEQWRVSQPEDCSVKWAVNCVAALCDGIQAAHATGVIHRDLKPSNILLDQKGKPRIADFGLASHHRRPLGRNGSYSGSGSLAFMAPEQYQNESAVAAPVSDVYSLGGLLAWLLTGQLPNGQSLPEAIAHLSKSGGQVRTELRQDLEGRVDRTLFQIVSRALSLSTDDRYQSADSFAADLRRWGAHEPIEWQQPSVRKRVTLFISKRPVTSLGSVVGVLSLAIISAGAVYAFERGVRNEIQSNLEHEKQISTEREFRLTQARESVQVWLRMMKNTGGMISDPDLISTITILENVLVPRVLEMDDIGNLLWDQRIQIVDEMLLEAEAKGERDDLEYILWENALGIWLLRAEEYDRSSLVLNENLQRLSGIAESDDPWGVLSEAAAAVAALRSSVSSQAEKAVALKHLESAETAGFPDWLVDIVESSLNSR